MSWSIIDFVKHVLLRTRTRTAHPKLDWFQLFWTQTYRLVSVGILITGITFGAKGFKLTLKDITVAVYNIDSDLQLALLGFFNKMLDVLLVSSLEYTASVLLTTWMTAEQATGKEPRGATFIDMDIKNELTKPWMTLYSFAVRSQWSWKNMSSLTFWKTSWRDLWKVLRSRRSWKSFGRLWLCLVISVSVLLQGLAINTVAIPKLRWYPNMPDDHNGWSLDAEARKQLTITYPKAYLEELTWSNIDRLAINNVGVVGSFEWSAALSASRSLDGIADITSTFSRWWTGWQPVLNRNVSGSRVWTGLNTTFDEGHVLETLSVSATQVWDVFQWLRDDHHPLGTNSTGWTGNLSLVVPVLNSKCELRTSEAIIPPNTITVNVPYEQPSSDPSLTIDLGPSPERDFMGARCTFTFRQALHSFGMWIIDMDAPDISQNQYWKKFNETLTYQPSLAQDFEIVRALAVHADRVLLYMNQLMARDGILAYLLLLSHKLRTDIPSITSDAHGLTVVMGVLLQNMISLSDSLSPPLPGVKASSSDKLITSYPIQWQIYGSGPRLAWEWSVVFVLVVIVCCFCFGIWQTIWYRMAPGSWTELSGMMMIANGTIPRLEDIDNEEKASRRLYAIDKETGTMLCSKADDGTK